MPSSPNQPAPRPAITLTNPSIPTRPQSQITEANNHVVWAAPASLQPARPDDCPARGSYLLCSRAAPAGKQGKKKKKKAILLGLVFGIRPLNDPSIRLFDQTINQSTNQPFDQGGYYYPNPLQQQQQAGGPPPQGYYGAPPPQQAPGAYAYAVPAPGPQHHQQQQPQYGGPPVQQPPVHGVYYPPVPPPAHHHQPPPQQPHQQHHNAVPNKIQVRVVVLGRGVFRSTCVCARAQSSFRSSHTYLPTYMHTADGDVRGAALRWGARPGGNGRGARGGGGRGQQARVPGKQVNLCGLDPEKKKKPAWPLLDQNKSIS